MAVDIGIEAVVLASSSNSGNTHINKANPASRAGVITSIEIWAQVNITGLRVGAFYNIGGTEFKCRDSVAIAGTITAGSKVTKAVTIAVEIGDYIGLYWTGGNLEYANSDYLGVWWIAGEKIDPDDQGNYSLRGTHSLSLGGYVEVIPPSSTINYKWHVYTLVNQTLQTIFNVRALVSKSNQLKWNVKTLVNDTINFKYAIEVLVFSERMKLTLKARGLSLSLNSRSFDLTLQRR